MPRPVSKYPTDLELQILKVRISEDQVSHRMLVDVVDRVFDGSASAVLMKLFDVKEIDTDELRELRTLINRKINET